MDELEKNTPKLSKQKRENPFGTPDRYFDTFSVRLKMKLEAEQEAPLRPKQRIIRFLKPALSLAASFALIFLLVYWPIKTFMPDQAIINTAQQDLNEMEYESMVEGIDENSFYALLDESIDSTKFTDDDLLSYLSTNISEYDIYDGTNNY
jgi:hypothetical protein